MYFIRRFLQTLFPEVCVGCVSRGSLLCDACSKKISTAPVASHAWSMSVFAYQDFRVKRLIRLLKYKNGKRVAKLFAPYMVSMLMEFLGEEQLFLGTTVALVPIPLSKKRRMQRGYNQAELLVKEMLQILPEGKCVLANSILVKNVETIPQADITKKSKRLTNLADCFSVTKASEGMQTVILIDDVTTTGATLVEARRVLREAGYCNVHAMTVAH